MQTETHSLETILMELRQSTKDNLSELKEALINLRAQQTNFISYFTYSFNISHHLQSDNMCLASYHIQNIGNTPITNPEIVLKLSNGSPFSFNGKYINQGSPIPSKLNDGWVRINNPANPHDLHLRPVKDTIILPGNTLAFSSFQIIWKPLEEYSGSITGWTFSDQEEEGLVALNAINISGTLPFKEDSDE